jgi:hypothetical protein
MAGVNAGPNSCSYSVGTKTSGNTDPALLTCIVQNSWLAAASTWTPFSNNSIFNIANEWGPANSTVWRDSYISAISQMRAAGYLGPLAIDTGGFGQDEADFENYAAAVFNSDPQKNIIFSYHMYDGTNHILASIASIQNGNPTVITLNGGGPCHPFAQGNSHSGPGYCPSQGYTNSHTRVSNFYINGAQGMTEINGLHPFPSRHVGGTSGAWTITLNVDSTNWGKYTGGGIVVDYDGNYQFRIQRLAALSRATGAAVIIGEFGPGNNISPSGNLTPSEVISAAEAHNLGWVAWAFDDNNTANSQSDNLGFSMTYHNAIYNVSSDLTIYGQEIIEGCTNPNPGGCGCPDSTPLPSFSSAVFPFTGTEPSVYTLIDPKCSGTPSPQYSGFGLKQLAKPASIF